ncbi:hypothetical protein [Thermoanaerobacterium sp. DL9XJH110]|uniref:hypothetical protein n=1 Tax=Thermoanaerobacterium sp. DL9XJH110 TaxID=3386643 RepID=UPI003BB67C69
MSKLEELKKEIKNTQMKPESVGEVLKKFGVTPDNPETVKEIIKEAGIKEDLTPEAAAQMVKSMTDNFPPEMKKMLADFIFQISDTVTATPMPQDLKNLLQSWKERGETSGKP